MPAILAQPRRANQRHHSIIAQFVKPPMALPLGLSASLQAYISVTLPMRITPQNRKWDDHFLRGEP
jgi:hypothetical protein